MTGKPIIIFLLLINFVLKMDEIKAPLPVPDPRLSSRAVPLPTASKCYWWPFCTSDTSICNGNQKSLCSVYGTNGSKRSEAPSELALARAVDRDQKWKQKCKDRICSWGCGRAVLCGGIIQTSCEKYGTNGTHKHLRPTSNEAKELVGELKKQKKRKRMEDQRANQSPSEKVAELEKNKKSKSDHRANQSPSEKTAERKGAKKRMSNHRANQSFSEKAAERKKNTESKSNHRANQSPSEKAAERKGAKKRMSDHRDKQSPSEKTAERGAKKRMSNHRANQSSSEKAAERAKNKKSKSDHRTNQSPSERAAEQETARNSMAKLRNASPSPGKKQQADFSTPCLTCLEDEQKITFEGHEQNPETAAMRVYWNTSEPHWRDAYEIMDPECKREGEDYERKVNNLCQRVRGQRASAERTKALLTEFFESQGRGWRQSDSKQDFLPGVSRDARMPACGCCGYRNLDVTRHLKYHSMSLADLDILKLSKEEAAQHR